MNCSPASLYSRDKSRTGLGVIRPAGRGRPDPAGRHCHYAKKKMDLQVHYGRDEGRLRLVGSVSVARGMR
jgi:hypothetical protein